MGEAFNLPLELHQPTLDRMKRIGLQMQQEALKSTTSPEPYELTEPRKRMALFPFSIKEDFVKVVYPVQALWVPIVIVNSNVHILPGFIIHLKMLKKRDSQIIQRFK